MHNAHKTSIYEKVVNLLLAKNLKITSAESCTGGLFSKIITDFSGVSQIFDGSVCTYSNLQKQKILGVKFDTIEKFTEVSPECACEMAKGALELFNADISVSFTGICGPLGGENSKPLGLVYVCVLYNDTYYVQNLNGFISRENSRNSACELAFNMILKLLD